MLLFDDDLGKRNQIDSILLSALVSHGLGNVETCTRQLEQVIALDPNHLFAAEMLSWLQQVSKAVPEGLEMDPAR
jgi:hypothetical protein